MKLKIFWKKIYWKILELRAENWMIKKRLTGKNSLLNQSIKLTRIKNLCWKRGRNREMSWFLMLMLELLLRKFMVKPLRWEKLFLIKILKKLWVFRLTIWEWSQGENFIKCSESKSPKMTFRKMNYWLILLKKNWKFFWDNFSLFF